MNILHNYLSQTISLSYLGRVMTLSMITSLIIYSNSQAKRLVKSPEKKENCVQGMVHGDPHFRTFNQISYDYHGRGEFLLVAAKDKHLRIHVRQEQLRPRSPISVVTGIGIHLGKDKIKYYTNRNDHRGGKISRVRLNGKILSAKKKKIKLKNGTLYQAPAHYLIETDQGESIYWDRLSNIMNVKVEVCKPKQYKGLLMPEISKKNQKNGRLRDLYTEQGAQYFRKTNKQKILHTPQKSAPNPKGNQSQHRLTDDQARDVCEQQKVAPNLMASCIFDVGLTGKASFAKNAVKMSKKTMSWVKEYSLSKMNAKQWRRKLNQRLPSIRKIRRSIRKLVKSSKSLSKIKKKLSRKSIKKLKKSKRLNKKIKKLF
jgi:hypothetical protein